MIENVKEVTLELERETLRDSELLRKPHIEVEKAGPYQGVSPKRAVAKQPEINTLWTSEIREQARVEVAVCGAVAVLNGIADAPRARVDRAVREVAISIRVGSGYQLNRHALLDLRNAAPRPAPNQRFDLNNGSS